MIYILAFASLIVLVVLHELGHFFAAKHYGVKVEEFGIGLPPRIIGKQFGETLYSLNLLPLGAFVRLQGEEQDDKSPRSFRSKSVFQRAVIIGAGVVTFWIVSVVMLTVLGATSGIPTGISDDASGITNPQVQITDVTKNSPAKAAGLELGDIIVSMQSGTTAGAEIMQVKQVQDFTAIYQGQEITMEIRRDGETLFIGLIPRENPPANEGAIGIALMRTGLLHYSWYEAPLRGIELTFSITGQILNSFWDLFAGLIQGQGAPP